MARPLFYAVAAARLDITPGAASRTAYYALAVQYQFGTPIIFARAPQELAATIGVAFYSQPADPGIAATTPGVVVVSFPYPTPSVVVGGVAYPVSTAATGGTIVGANYIDGNGVLHPDVDWEWEISVEAYQNSTGVLPPTIGTFEAQVVFWTGDGTNNRLIPTTFSLAAGDVAIWGCGGIDKAGGASATSQVNFFRHNGASMTGTQLAGVGNNPVSGGGTDGITSFEAGGFRVSAGSFVFLYGNTLNVKYAAIVMKDTSSVYLRVGTYLGFLNAPIHLASVVQNVSGAVTRFDGNWAPYVGLGPITIHHPSAGDFQFTALDLNNGTISPVFPNATGGIEFFVISAGIPGTQRTIPIAQSAVRVLPLSHLWVWPFGYKSTDIPADLSVNFVSGASAAAARSDGITALSAAGFTVTDAYNSNNLIHSYVGLCADAAFLLRKFFKSLAGVATGAAMSQNGVGFTPSIAFSRNGSTVRVGGAIWRSLPWVTTPTTSMDVSVPGGAPYLDTTGITAINVDGVDLGVDATSSVAGDPFYSWFWTGGSIPVTGPPTYVPVPVPGPPGDPAGQGCTLVAPVGAGGVSGIGCRVGTAITPSV